MPPKRKRPLSPPTVTLASTRARRTLTLRSKETQDVSAITTPPSKESQLGLEENSINERSMDGSKSPSQVPTLCHLGAEDAPSASNPGLPSNETRHERKDRESELKYDESEDDFPKAFKRARRDLSAYRPKLEPLVPQSETQVEACATIANTDTRTSDNNRLKLDDHEIKNDLPGPVKQPGRTSTPRQRHRRNASKSKPTSNRRVQAQRRVSSTNIPPSNETYSAPDLDLQNLKDVDQDTPEIVRSRPYSGPMRLRTQLALGLPPLYKLSDIYKSLTKRAIELDFDEVLRHLGERRLRVVTVCSGTESPLLALEMVRENLQKHFDRDFNFKHLFSAEIVPFKQAYIERNFHPRLIFRDVAELKDRVAQTAYGSLEKIPKNADILIAGFSCVDFSGLNNHRKTLDEKGESGGTFWGIIRYAMTYRPRLVILENVKTAPWDKIEKHWNEIDYFAVHADVDTKAYYLPQTRERGYMFCVDRRLMNENCLSEVEMLKWTDVLAQFKRPASSPAGMFLMDADDRRLEQIEKDMAMKITSSAASSRATVNWARYQVRHQSYRLNQGLGHRRPVSKSQDDGTCRMPDFAWQTWVKSLPERVWDTIDVNFLRKLAEGYDMNYKERCLELSQGIDREIDTRAYGIVGCITPCGIPYMTTRGGPLCGLESLALQGLPLDRLLLTQESQRELQDLAGNAMSSTVVGAAILSALIVGHAVLKKGNTSEGPHLRSPKLKAITPRVEDNLVPSSMDLDLVTAVDVSGLQVRAASSARYCVCERQSSTKATILRCKLCSHTACSECSGNPIHAYERWTDLVRSAPLDFVSELRSILPARLVVSGISRENYREPQWGSSATPHIWNEFLDAILRAFGDELRFLDAKRSEVWTVLYEGKFSVLKLVIEPSCINWLLFAKPRDSDPAVCLIREVLSKPIARMAVPQSGSLLDGTWEICAPLSSKCTLEIFGSGDMAQSYESKCGLELAGFKDSTVWTHITVQGADEKVSDLDVDIRGTYELLQDCGTANACLHRRAATDGKPAVFLFLDPTKLGEPKNDSFVFSLEHRRNPGYVSRLTIAEISHKWRSSTASEAAEETTVYYRKWLTIPAASLRSYDGVSDSHIKAYYLDPATSFDYSNGGCHNANITLMSFTAPVGVIDSPCGTTEWAATDPVESPHLLRDYAWLFQKAAAQSSFGEWNHVAENGWTSPCSVCVPTKPRILWGRNRRGWIRAYEDPFDAARYERQVKSRPSPFLIFRRSDELGVRDFRITLNVQTLLHQAIPRLMDSSIDNLSLHWRLVPNSYDTRNFLFPKFRLKTNRHDLPSSQPPGFLLNLRPEQLRSLSWMIRQEDDNVEPFMEEEIEEALLAPLMWRAEARVTASKTVRGGILADDVGYGKTAIVLGLIDSQSAQPTVNLSISLNANGYIPSRATLIVVPSIMLQQWQSEITKFLGDRYKVLVFHSAAALAKTTLRDMRDCEIVLVSWSVFNTPAYYQRLQKFSGAPRVPAKAGRHFDDWFHHAHQLMRRHVRVLTEEGPSAFLSTLQSTRSEIKGTEQNYKYVPSKRLRGKQYELAHQDQEVDMQTGVSYAEISSADEDPEMSDDENSEALRTRVGQLLKLVPPKPFGAKKQETDQDHEVYSTDEETEYEMSSSETCDATAKGRGNGKKRKRNRAIAGNKTQNAWNDREQFNIARNAESQPWEKLTASLFHAFEFNRLVIDEFTYVNAERLTQLLSLEARSKWVLSGTPPLNDFADVNTIAPFLGVHLGIDDDGDMYSQNKRLKSLHRQRSEAETFRSFQASRSEAWHRRRHEIAQIFLDQFARRNVAEIDEIPSTEHIVLVHQSPAEKVVYLELYKQLMTYNRQLRRSGNRGRFGSDQADRLDEIIGSSSTAEEALLKRCTSLALRGRWDGDGRPEPATCESLIRVRLEQLEKLKDELKSKLKLAAWVYCACDVRHEKFHKFIESVIRHDFGDMTVTSEVYPLLKTAILTSKGDDWKLFFSTSQEGENHDDEEVIESSKANSASKKSKATLPFLPTKPTRVSEFEPTLREITTTIRNLIVEWVLRERALRFLKTVQQVQTGAQKVIPCHQCQNQPDLLETMSILGSCGHALCSNCTPKTIEKEECAVEGCRGSGKRFNIINALTLSSRDLDRDLDKSSEYGGTKLDTLINIISNKIPSSERALLFIQFPELMEIASKALQLAGIKHIVISSTDRKSTQKIEQFQKTSFGENKVLLLNLGSEMAAGLNLQCANHVIFLSPLLAQSQYDYDSSMIQAIGRCRRYGQTRHVHVYHLLAKRTIDVNIFQERRGKVMVERDGGALLISPEEALESEAMTCQGPELVVDNAF
ncbi:putative SNF2 family helicase [Aspergillus lucknowensis]|uniref:Helicase C-terminal domain-containing protein n=1 Tax=Aspergillus lucknowensis TaxID=176173 RepID=A0ABR4M7J5_9EURO